MKHIKCLIKTTKAERVEDKKGTQNKVFYFQIYVVYKKHTLFF